VPPFNASSTTPSITPTLAPTVYPPCKAPFCSGLDSELCTDIYGVGAATALYRIKCDSSLAGLEMYWPGQRKRAYVSSFEECLRHCAANVGCSGATYEYSDCSLYGPDPRFTYDPGSVAAKLMFRVGPAMYQNSTVAAAFGNWSSVATLPSKTATTSGAFVLEPVPTTQGAGR
jgi:hypothetical protein